MHHCKTIGLTGGIASGKSAVSDYFMTLDCKVIDADIVARQVVEPNSEGLNQLVKQFGKTILSTTNTLDRSKLRKIVFNDKVQLSQLNAILHPLINEEIIQQVKKVKDRFCLVVIPLLCESSRYKWLDRVLLVDVKPETQLKRLLKRDGITVELAKNMMNSQCSRKQRLSIADDVINNELTRDELFENIKILNRLYQKMY